MEGFLKRRAWTFDCGYLVITLCKVDSVVTDSAMGRTLVQGMYIVHLDYQTWFNKLTYLII